MFLLHNKLWVLCAHQTVTSRKRVSITRVYLHVHQLIRNCQVEKWQQKYNGLTEKLW